MFVPALIKFSPLLLLLLSPFIHHLILTSALLLPPVFLFVGSFISIFQCSVGYGFGRIQGVKGTEWIINHGFVSENKVNQMQGWIRFSAPLVLFLIPGPIVAMISGASKLKPSVFFTCMIPAQILWISACFMLGRKLEVYLNEVNNWLANYWIIITLSLVIIKLIHTFITRYKKLN